MTAFQGCPGSKLMSFKTDDSAVGGEAVGRIQSQLSQWPIQMHLVSPIAPYYQGADVLLAADCVAYSLGDFHSEHLKEKSLGIACPKLDVSQEVYLEKIKTWFDEAKINTLTVMIMQVPCCMGLLNLVKQAAEVSNRKVPIKFLVVGVQGDILEEKWV